MIFNRENSAAEDPLGNGVGDEVVIRELFSGRPEPDGNGELLAGAEDGWISLYKKKPAKATTATTTTIMRTLFFMN